MSCSLLLRSRYYSISGTKTKITEQRSDLRNANTQFLRSTDHQQFHSAGSVTTNWKTFALLLPLSHDFSQYIKNISLGNSYSVSSLPLLVVVSHQLWNVSGLWMKNQQCILILLCIKISIWINAFTNAWTRSAEKITFRWHSSLFKRKKTHVWLITWISTLKIKAVLD